MFNMFVHLLLVLLFSCMFLGPFIGILLPTDFSLTFHHMQLQLIIRQVVKNVSIVDLILTVE